MTPMRARCEGIERHRRSSSPAAWEMRTTWQMARSWSPLQRTGMTGYPTIPHASAELPLVAGMVENRSSEMSVGMLSPTSAAEVCGADDGRYNTGGNPATRSIRCSEYPRLPNRRPPGQAGPPLRPRTKVGKSKFKARRRRLSRLGAFIWEKWWRVFWAILFWLAF